MGRVLETCMASSVRSGPDVCRPKLAPKAEQAVVPGSRPSEGGLWVVSSRHWPARCDE